MFFIHRRPTLDVLAAMVHPIVLPPPAAAVVDMLRKALMLVMMSRKNEQTKIM